MWQTALLKLRGEVSWFFWNKEKMREKKEAGQGLCLGMSKASLSLDASRIPNSSIKIYDSHERLEERELLGKSLKVKDPLAPRFLSIRHLCALSHHLLRAGSCSGHSTSFEQGLEALGSSPALPLTSYGNLSKLPDLYLSQISHFSDPKSL